MKDPSKRKGRRQKTTALGRSASHESKTNKALSKPSNSSISKTKEKVQLDHKQGRGADMWSVITALKRRVDVLEKKFQRKEDSARQFRIEQIRTWASNPEDYR